MEATGGDICPVKLLREYLQWRGDQPGPLFLDHKGGQLSTGAISSLVRRMAKENGFDGCYSSHSLRIGGATAAMEGGMSKEQIQAIGGWTSEAVQRYLRAREAMQLRASHCMGF